MDLRNTLIDIAASLHLGPAATAALERHAGLHDEPQHLLQHLPRALVLLAALLCGLGLVFWIAANWGGLPRWGRFALLQGVVVLMLLAAVLRPALRVPLALLAFIATGALFAYFGQTYQTGADPWQLFALWALLMLPAVALLRSDTLWCAWVIVALTAAALWATAHTGHRWRALPGDAVVHGVGWCAALLIAAVLSPPLRRASGAGPWAWRVALVLAVVMIGSTALAGLFQGSVAPQYGLGLAVLGLLAVLLMQGRVFDIVGLSAAALGLNTLLFGGFARWLFEGGGRGDEVGRLLLLGLLAAAMLAGTVSLLLRLNRTHHPEAA
jgi:Predicted membrane protein (DUF2157)